MRRGRHTLCGCRPPVAGRRLPPRRWLRAAIWPCARRPPSPRFAISFTPRAQTPRPKLSSVAHMGIVLRHASCGATGFMIMHRGTGTSAGSLGQNVSNL